MLSLSINFNLMHLKLPYMCRCDFHSKFKLNVYLIYRLFIVFDKYSYHLTTPAVTNKAIQNILYEHKKYIFIKGLH